MIADIKKILNFAKLFFCWIQKNKMKGEKFIFSFSLRAINNKPAYVKYLMDIYDKHSYKLLWILYELFLYGNNYKYSNGVKFNINFKV
jgi:hypothetical protein